jgi:hypothetical protein
MIAAAAVVILIGGVALAWIGGQLGPPFPDPGMVIGFTILIVMILVCCSSMLVIGRFAARMPQYGEMEIRFEEGMEFYNNQEWEPALEVFKKEMGPELDHKRALFYGAKCCEKLDDLDCVKKYIKRYLELQPKDKQAWEMLADAHKKLFEYEEAEDALKKAAKL